MPQIEPSVGIVADGQLGRQQVPIKAVFFDVGETLVDETRQWFSWADWLGVSRLSFCAAFGAVIERGEHHRRVFDAFVPDFDLKQAEASRVASGQGYTIEPRDLYPDALAALHELRGAGYRVGIAGNQPEEAEGALKACGVEADYIASSARWGVEKPSPAFFARVIEIAGCRPSEIAYVGDRLDNDILPARRAGMCAVFLVRGPWGFIHARRLEAGQATITIHSLIGLSKALASLP
jgi:HAD superfamily hydrolase (TIGR01549 family)